MRQMKLTRRSFLKAAGCSAIAIAAGLKNHKPVIAGPVLEADDIKQPSKIHFYSTPTSGDEWVKRLYFGSAEQSKSIDFYGVDKSYSDDDEEFVSLMQERSKRPPYANKIRKLNIEG